MALKITVPGSPSARPATLELLPDAIPLELRRQDHWLGWAWTWDAESRGWDKPPRSALTRQVVDATNPGNWSTFDRAVEAYRQGGLDGLGFALRPPEGAEECPVGIDLDKCVNPATGEIEAWARREVSRFNSYTERTPSGTGLRIFVLARPLARGRKSGHREIYCRVRYLTVTGQHVEGAPKTVERRQAAVDAFLAEYFPEPPPGPGANGQHPPGGSGAWQSDDELVRQAMSAGNGEKFRRLWQGSSDGYPSDSEADLALLVILAFWTRKDAGRMEALFDASARSERPKWARRADYRRRSIARAIELQKDVYGPGGGPSGGGPDNAGGAGAPAPEGRPWPDGPAEEAYHGLAGEIVRIIEPASEADPAALLVQLLVAFGNVIGREPHFVVEGDRHHANEYVVIVGETSKARKGTSWGRIRALFAEVEGDWVNQRVAGGLSSGEGLMWAVRDPEPEGDEDGEGSPPASDKRLLVYEPEFAGVLKQTERHGNTLSVILRQGWDTGNLRTLTRNNPIRVTDGHISLIGHITVEELRRCLTETESANGFGNRHLWVCAKRSKLLPEGGAVGPAAFRRGRGALAAAIKKARTVGAVQRDGEARALWCEIYTGLSEGRPGLAGALLARGEAHVMRLAMLHALMDGATVIGAPHLKAALALWRYVERSVHYVFGDSLGDPVADEVLLLLRANPRGLTRTDLRDYFGRHQSSERIGRALAALLRYRLARREQEQTGGRPVERWFATAPGRTG
jgi:hypothetical protein